MGNRRHTIGLSTPDMDQERNRLKKLADEFCLSEFTSNNDHMLRLEVLSTELRLAGYLPGESKGRVLPVRSTVGELKTDGAPRVNRDVPLYRAVLGRAKPQGKRVLDVTGGLGQDTWLLAAYGCSLLVVEQNAVIFALLRDGVARAGIADQQVARRIRLIYAPGQKILTQILESERYGPQRVGLPRPHVVYMDPFFSSERKRKGACKRSMKVLRFVAHEQTNDNGSKLLDLGLQVAVDRVVVKRPRVCAPFDTAFGKRIHNIQGRGYRFDIYKK